MTGFIKLRQEKLPETTTSTVISITSTKLSVDFTDIPGISDTSNPYVKGKVVDIGSDYENYRIALYIKVDGGYWSKPYKDQKLTEIESDGTFTVRYNTGGNDINATEFAVFVVKKDYFPPTLDGSPSLPTELNEKAIAKAVETR